MFDLRAFWRQSLIGKAVNTPSTCEEIEVMSQGLLSKGLISGEDAELISKAITGIKAVRDTANTEQAI